MYVAPPVALSNRAPCAYVRRAPLILINGLAEQAESWYCNVDAWRRHFDVYTPQLLAYEGTTLHRRIAAGQPIDVAYLVERLHKYLDDFVQTPPYHLVANSLGGKVAVEFAARYPHQVARLVLLCPSGLSDVERLPIINGVRRNDLRSLMASVFQDPSHVDPGLLAYYQKQFANRRWRTGLLKTIRGTMHHRVRDRLAQVPQPTLLVVGREDRIVDPRQATEAAGLLSHGKLVVLPHCGHAPQIEQADFINRLVVEFLQETTA
ncbi:MAG TPA: alpha/beta fold hydrolase [Gemmataceae bacterium]|nr:alpha/beta fold hydrolase [Gemmataceae bacterium]